MASSFSIESILATPVHRPILPSSVVRSYPHPYFVPAGSFSVTIPGMNLPSYHLTTNKRRKRYRTIFSETQIELLEELYRTTQYPDLYQRENVAMLAGLQEERVEVWFKNRRARCRKVKRAKNSVSEMNAADNRKDENVNKTNEVVMDCSTKDQNTHKGLH
ncbi:homeobox protein goosecoid-like [Xenia sp. Carnegie-2017]|uniref:homeobox protein goosecoid-like n=1 Tax=Xenia sp. Carnegie-2017 TaxID=2897299 RepID=UPI001F03B083|nr:homeobox protein goosecoid-like [Xenia sp. Carnegie-2017]